MVQTILTGWNFFSSVAKDGAVAFDVRVYEALFEVVYAIAEAGCLVLDAVGMCDPYEDDDSFAQGSNVLDDVSSGFGVG